ncbi:hypothetical protein HNQ81_001114 [Desulfoprunum benzoelyticum]|uniref:Uncharacterized protein n=1 Tax=Desulfoprunum benzoelyticum TaxID=1506996 RepID=A0A840UXJ0_9BACT|nr:hypothetical protein [Desulfoprunum benzoelyticum]
MAEYSQKNYPLIRSTFFQSNCGDRLDAAVVRTGR